MRSFPTGREEAQKEIGEKTQRIKFSDGNHAAHVEALYVWLHHDLHHLPDIDWKQLPSRVIGYLVNVVGDSPFAPHIALAVGTAIGAAGTSYLYQLVTGLNSLIRTLRTQCETWNGVDLTRSVWEEYVTKVENTPARRRYLLNYSAITERYMHDYVERLSPELQARIASYLLPRLPGRFVEQHSGVELDAIGQQRRKERSDVLAPLHSVLVALIQLRKQAAQRLLCAFREACERVERGEAELPLVFTYEDTLPEVNRHLQAGQITAHAPPLAISGLGGIGKTQLALEYAYWYRQDYQMILWVRAESTDALISSYVAIATLLRLPECEAKEQDIAVQAVKTWLQTHRDWLLILDNADDLTLLSNFLPPSPRGHLLLTTRAATTGRLARRLEIETLLPEQGALLLLQRAGLIAPDTELSQALPQERELALQISQELGGLPLALDQAGAYLEETGTDLESYWSIYQQHRADLLRERRGLVADHPAGVSTTWSLSFERVEEKNPAAADLLRLCAFLSPDAIPEEILTMGASLLGSSLAEVATDAFRLNQTIETLRAYSLVRRDPKGKTLSIHRLVQAVLQDAQQETEQRLWAERAMLAVNTTFPDTEHGTWPQCERLLPQALMATQIIEQYQIRNLEAGRLLHETANYLKDRARYTEAEPL